jgi:hypothetical protein
MPCRRCGTPTAASFCERCHGVRRLVPDGGRETDKWNPAVNEEWDSETRAEYLERQSRSIENASSTESEESHSGSEGDSSSEAPDSGTPPDTEEPPQGEPQPDETSGSDLFSRRRLLLGGAGLAVAATGGRQLLSGGLDGARGVAADYIEAVADNDWEKAGGLYHEASRTRENIDQRESIDSYEDYLGDRGNLEFLSAIEPAIRDIYEWRYVRDPEEGDLPVTFAPDRVEEMDAWKRLIGIVSVDSETYYEFRGRTDDLDQIASETTNKAFRLESVQEQTEWSLWNVSYPV